MSHKDEILQKNTERFILFSLVGGAIAGLLFLGTFILSSRAKTPNPHANLYIPIPPIPEKPAATPPLESSEAPVLASPSPTLDEIIAPILESLQSEGEATSPAIQEEEILPVFESTPSPEL